MDRQQIETISTPHELLAACGNEWTKVEELLAQIESTRESWAKFALKAIEALASKGLDLEPEMVSSIIQYKAIVPRLAAIAAKKAVQVPAQEKQSILEALKPELKEVEEFGEKVAEKWQPSEREQYKPVTIPKKQRAAAHGTAEATQSNTTAKAGPMSTSKDVGNFDRLVEALQRDATPAQKKAYAEKALFKIRLQYYPQAGYEKGFEANSYGRDRVSEQNMFADEANVRRVKAMLERGTNVADIFGEGGFLAAKAFNAWKYNLAEIEKIAREGHPSWGRLQSAHIFFQPVKNAQGWPVEIFRYEDQ